MEQNFKKALRKASNVNSLLLILFYALVFSGAFVIQLLLPQIMDETGAYYTACNQICVFLFQYVIVVPILLLIFRAVLGKKIGWKLKDSYHKPQATAGQCIRWCLISLGLVYATTFFSNIFFNILQMLTGMQLHAPSMVAEQNWFGYLTNFFAFAILAPIFEEMLFRATLFRNTERFGGWFAVVMTGIFFGLWHGNYAQIIYAAMLGVCVAFLTAKTRSVLPAMAVHFIMNLIGAIQSVAYSGIDISDPNYMNPSHLMEHIGNFAVIGIMVMVVIGFMITGLILLIIELVKHRETFRLENTVPQVSGGRKALVYLTAPVTVVCVIGLLAITIWNAIG